MKQDPVHSDLRDCASREPEPERKEPGPRPIPAKLGPKLMACWAPVNTTRSLRKSAEGSNVPRDLRWKNKPGGGQYWMSKLSEEATNLKRVGSLARDKPISLLERLWSYKNLSLAIEEDFERAREDVRLKSCSSREGENPREVKAQESIGLYRWWITSYMSANSWVGKSLGDDLFFLIGFCRQRVEGETRRFSRSRSTKENAWQGNLEGR
jgi:hypothetical protein